MTAPTDLPPELAVQVFAARIEAKLDVALERHGAQLGEHARRLDDHEARLRAEEARPATALEVDTRLRAVESRPVVTPASVWKAAGVIGGAVTVALTLAEKIAN